MKILFDNLDAELKDGDTFILTYQASVNIVPVVSELENLTENVSPSAKVKSPV